MKKLLKNIWIYLLAIFLIIIDQITKFLVVENVDKLPLKAYGKAIKISYCENRGVAFSIGDGNVGLFVIINTILILGMIIYFERNRQAFSNLGKFWVSCVLAGGVGNLIDRATRGFVVDFFDVTRLDRFPNF